MPKLKVMTTKLCVHSCSNPGDSLAGGSAQEGGPDEGLLTFKCLLPNKVKKISEQTYPSWLTYLLPFYCLS